MTDKLFVSAMGKITDKYMKGLEEHGGLEKADMSLKEALIMLQEEHIDSVFYIEKVLEIIENEG